MPYAYFIFSYNNHLIITKCDENVRVCILFHYQFVNNQNIPSEVMLMSNSGLLKDDDDDQFNSFFCVSSNKYQK